MSTTFKPVALLAGVLALAGCDSILDPGSRELRQIGVLSYYGSPVSVSVPDTVTAGVPFQVSMTTYGNGCYRQGAVVRQVVGLFAQLEPFDYVTVGRRCTQELQTFTHEESVTFATPGTAEVLITGMQLPDGVQVRAERSVHVRAP